MARVRSQATRALAAALLCGLIARASALPELPEGLQALIGGRIQEGEAAPVPCNNTPLAGSWLEMTQILNFTQYKSAEGADLSGVPDPLPPPYSLSAKDTRAPGFTGSCISRSPSAPSDCEGDDCFAKIEEWGVSWLEFATLDCLQSYPTPDLVDFFTSPVPPPGNVSVVVTGQCKNYFYSDWFYSITDEWGNKWALQTSQENDTTPEEWAANVESVVWPTGWSAVENVTLAETETHVPWLAGDACIWLILKDSNDNAWHQYTYPSSGLMGGNDILSAIDECVPLNAAYTIENGGGAGEGPSPAPAPASAPPPTEAPPSGAAATASSALLAVLAALAAAVAM